MLGLIPTELWNYGLRDLGRGVVTALGRRESPAVLSIPGLGNCIPARSARSALVTAIKALDLPPGSRIGVPLYCCAVVFKAILAAGCRPRFVDVDVDTFCMSASDLKRKASEVDAVIAVHMFGNVCDMAALREAIPGKPIIEDCALSLGSKFDGQLTGLFGDAAVVSFRSGKYLSVGEGGAFFSIHPSICGRAMALISSLPTPSRREEGLHVAKTFLRSALRTKPLYGLAGYALWEAYNRKAEFSAKSPVIEGQIYRTDLALTVARLDQLDTAIHRRRANANYLAAALDLEPGMLCQEAPRTFYNRYQYPITFPSREARDFMADYLHRKQIDSSKPVQDATEIGRLHYGYDGDCPATELLSNCVLVIPSYETLKKSEIEKIALCINEGWAEISSGNLKSKSAAAVDYCQKGANVSAGI
ncbi:MAG TPA: DegT/DnrJ/EryC1/StrS family aminotransferase [Candidatus Udaeobacter sp.]|jgi:dTDP-4-amino-4,6-dideoxygalactose transaminase|nr:DegT/DnrJ/EryC1/StrS family aminotransferase [Candidatus Udaeobacter sp.]